MLNRQRGFTLVEVMIVIIVIAVLAAMTLVVYPGIQAGARNDSTKSKTTIISNALERYYEQNGEYPTCIQMTQTPATVSSTVLNGGDPDILTRAGTASGTNSINCTTATTSNITYTGGGSGYTLQYKEEYSGKTVTINSNHAPRSAVAGTNSLSISQNAGNVVASANSSSCSYPTSTYAFQYQLNDGTWSGYDAFTAANTRQQSATAGYKYVYQVKTQCADGSQSAESVVSNTLIIPVVATSAPTMAVSISGANVVGTMTSVGCPASTTAQNRMQWLDRATAASGSWSAWTGWTAAGPTNTRAANQGWQSVYQGEGFCQGLYANSSTASTGQASAVRPIAQPAPPTWWSQYNYFNSSTGSWKNTLNFTTYCPTGTWVINNTFDSYADWGSEHWYYSWPYPDWWQNTTGSTKYPRYYARYACASDYATSPVSSDMYYNSIPVYTS